jgi:hypothetical protein
MGNDGGSIPKRRELVKSASRNPTVSELKATALESLGYAWTTDPVTTEQLDTTNTVSDWRGRLYSYETILQGLVNGSDSDEAPVLINEQPTDEKEEFTFASTGIKSLRDVVKIHFQRTETGSGGSKKILLTCPISLKELGPATRSVYLVPCGHAFAEIAIKEIPDHICPVCNNAFETRDVISILPTEQSDLARLAKRIEQLRAAGLTHSLKKEKGNKKKDKKRKAIETDAEAGTETLEDRTAETSKTDAESSKKATVADSRLSGINNAFAATLTARVLADQDQANKRRRLAAAR